MAIHFGPMSATGDEIRKARQARGLSQAELAAEAKVGQRTVGRLERGESEEPRKLGAVQRVLGIGPYKPENGVANENDPPLSRATFPELLQAIAARYGEAVRAGSPRATSSGGIHLSTTDRLPPEVLELGPDGVIGDWRHPDEGRSSG